jgi:hypothetical protein
MRKIGAISMAAFYLLLTTGVFACLLHCTEMYLFQPKVAMESHHDEAREKHKGNSEHSEGDKEAKDDDCGPGKNCDCCSKDHGLYLVKENLKDSFRLQLTTLTLSVVPAPYISLPERLLSARELHSWPHTTGPPQLNRPPLYLFNRTLLI